MVAVKAMYENATSVCVWLVNSDEFSLKISVHQGTVLSPLLFIIVMEALSRRFKVCCSWEFLHADDVVLLAETFEDLKKKLAASWKNIVMAKGLRVNAIKQNFYAANTVRQSSQILQNGHAVFVAKVLGVTQSSSKVVTSGFTGDARKSKEG